MNADVMLNKQLSQAERRVAALVPSGMTNKEIGSKLTLSYKTVSFHMTMIFKKLGIHNRTQLTTVILQGKLADLGDNYDGSKN